MSKGIATMILILCLLVLVTAEDDEFPRGNCDEEGFWSIESIMQCQLVSDFRIAVAYFSIPLELVYFIISCTNIPFKWVMAQFIAFIVLCGMTHLLNGWTYAPHTLQMMLAYLFFKILTTLVSQLHCNYSHNFDTSSSSVKGKKALLEEESLGA
ncbi:hypothetical protein IFM89_025321 [Coptis chinensis]|uniref:Ethylene receptor 1-like N-terminal domain-containing protein n=1 Tax=Coptis chinensis TaxID=261450 RepID=A0A835I5B7_9MAGN|nr:hypothetical protein IFM89_025321 [Coptis chinensis]